MPAMEQNPTPQKALYVPPGQRTAAAGDLGTEKTTSSVPTPTTPLSEHAPSVNVTPPTESPIKSARRAVGGLLPPRGSTHSFDGLEISSDVDDQMAQLAQHRWADLSPEDLDSPNRRNGSSQRFPTNKTISATSLNSLNGAAEEEPDNGFIRVPTSTDLGDEEEEAHHDDWTPQSNHEASAADSGPFPRTPPQKPSDPNRRPSPPAPADLQQHQQQSVSSAGSSMTNADVGSFGSAPKPLGEEDEVEAPTVHDEDSADPSPGVSPQRRTPKAGHRSPQPGPAVAKNKWTPNMKRNSPPAETTESSTTVTTTISVQAQASSRQPSAATSHVSQFSAHSQQPKSVSNGASTAMAVPAPRSQQQKQTSPPLQPQPQQTGAGGTGTKMTHSPYQMPMTTPPTAPTYRTSPQLQPTTGHPAGGNVSSSTMPKPINASPPANPNASWDDPPAMHLPPAVHQGQHQQPGYASHQQQVHSMPQQHYTPPQQQPNHPGGGSYGQQQAAHPLNGSEQRAANAKPFFPKSNAPGAQANTNRSSFQHQHQHQQQSYGGGGPTAMTAYTNPSHLRRPAGPVPHHFSAPSLSAPMARGGEVNAVHARVLLGRVRFIPYCPHADAIELPRTHAVISNANSVGMTPDADCKQMCSRFFVGHWWRALGTGVFQWLLDTFVAPTLTAEEGHAVSFYAQPHLDHQQRFKGCMHLNICCSKPELVVGCLHHRVLFDREGVWYADTVEQQQLLEHFCAELRSVPLNQRHGQLRSLPPNPLACEPSDN